MTASPPLPPKRQFSINAKNGHGNALVTAMFPFHALSRDAKQWCQVIDFTACDERFFR
jgi:hypothetical protein